jgi:PAS domain S-box-containing protein
MQQKTDPQDFEKRFRECDDKFNTVFKLTSAASKIIASDLTILKVNDALAELMGYSASEIEGTKILEHACEDYRKHWHELQMELWSNEVPFFKLQACLYKKDKSLVWVNVTTILFKDQGKTFGFTILDDITGLKDFEESQKRLNMALKYSKMAVWQMSLKNNAVHRSEGHDELFGYDRLQPKWTIESYLPLIWEEDRPKFLSAIRSLPDHKSVDHPICMIMRKQRLRQ